MEPLRVVAIDMGYGHMRAAEPIARLLGTKVLQADLAPIGRATDERLWARVRQFHEHVSRLSQVPVLGPPMRTLLETVTSIPPLYPYRDLSGSTIGVSLLDHLIAKGLGRGLVEDLEQSGAPLVTTFYGPAMVANRARVEKIHCVVTDSDINRIWVPANPKDSRIHYCVPSLRAQRRLRAYGIDASNISYTGFPLPDELVGGTDLSVLKANLKARLVRLDPRGAFREQARHDLDQFLGPLPPADPGEPPLLTFAVGGAGAQTRIVSQFLRGFRHSITRKTIRIALVAGVRESVAEHFRDCIRQADLGAELGGAIQIVLENDWASYYTTFNRLLARTDILWTKPSELVFYAALGLPEVLAWPVGVHERYNRRWVLEAGGGLKQGDPRFASQWIQDWLQDGSLAAAAWSGFLRLPKFGSYRIADLVRG